MVIFKKLVVRAQFPKKKKSQRGLIRAQKKKNPKLTSDQKLNN